MLSEMLVDWLKHAFITKFNHIRPSVYERYIDVLCRDLASMTAMGRYRARKVRFSHFHRHLLDQRSSAFIRGSVSPGGAPPWFCFSSLSSCYHFNRVRIYQPLVIGFAGGYSQIPILVKRS